MSATDVPDDAYFRRNSLKSAGIRRDSESTIRQTICAGASLLTMKTTDVSLQEHGEPLPALGAVPPALAKRFQQVQPPSLPPVARLPRPGDRDPVTGSSRSWLISANRLAAPADRFLFSVRQPGKIRGAVFINVEKLLRFLQKAEAAENASAAVA